MTTEKNPTAAARLPPPAHRDDAATSLPSLIYLDRTREEGKPVFSPDFEEKDVL